MTLWQGFLIPMNVQKKMNFPAMPMGTENYYIYIWSNSDISVEKAEDLKNRKIGCTEDSMQEAALREWNQKNGDLCNIVTYSGNDAMYHAFVAHEIDAVVDTDNAIEPTDGVLPVVKVGSSNYYLAVAKNRTDVYEKLNDALTLIDSQNPYFTLELQQKYFSETAIRSVLTVKEREWLEKNPVITIGYVEDYAPFCITSEAGMAHGMMIDIIDGIWRDLNVPSEKEYRSYKTYKELVEALHKGEVDIVLPVYENAWYSEKDGIIESTVISSFGVDMVYEDKYIFSDEDIIAIAANSPIQSRYVSLFFPENPQLICDTQDDCIKAVKNGKAKGVLINPYRAGSVLKNNRSLKVMQLTDGVSVCMGTRKEDTQLISILNRGILLYGEKNITHSLLHHTDESYEISFTTYIWEHWVLFFVLVVSVFLIIIGGAIAIIIIINDSRKKLIKNEKKMGEQLEILHSLSEIYTYMNLIDFENEKVICFNADELRVDSDLMPGEIRTEVNKKLANQIVSEHKEQFIKFTGITTLKQRLENKK